VEKLPIHGGSNRYWLTSNSESNSIDESVEEMLRFESESKLFEAIRWSEYSMKVSKILTDFRNWLHLTNASSGRIFGYGAAAKASTILNSIEIEAGLIEAIADTSTEKQSRFMPPNGIRIISPMTLFVESPTDIVIFPWNIKSEIAQYLEENLGEKTRLWSVIPEMHEVRTH
jgi:hypothetical protein